MDQIYFYTGFIVIWLSMALGFLLLTGLLFKLILDELGKQCSDVWIIVDYARHRDKFKKWLEKNE